MTPVRTVRLVAAFTLVGLAIGCSKSSSGPGDPFSGSWSVTVQQFIYNVTPPDTGSVTPTPFTLTITQGAPGVYTADWPALNWNLTVNGLPPGSYAIPASSGTAHTVSVSSDILTVHIASPSWFDATCELQLVGQFSGQSAQGGIHFVGGNCGTVGADAADGAWTATKQ